MLQNAIGLAFERVLGRAEDRLHNTGFEHLDGYAAKAPNAIRLLELFGPLSGQLVTQHWREGVHEMETGPEVEDIRPRNGLGQAVAGQETRHTFD